MAVKSEMWSVSHLKLPTVTNFTICIFEEPKVQIVGEYIFYSANKTQKRSGRMSNIYIQEPPTNGKVSARLQFELQFFRA